MVAAALGVAVLGPVTPFRSVVSSEQSHVAVLETVAGNRGITLVADAEPASSDSHLPAFRRCA